MTIPQGNLVSFIGPIQPLEENAHVQNDDDELLVEIEEGPISSCGCLRGLCWQKNINIGFHRYSQLDQVNYKENWFTQKAKKVKQVSEVLAGPKWKNFTRKFSTWETNNKKKRKMQYNCQYDPQSYKLNFDDGIHKDYIGSQLDFSVRYAVPVLAGDEN